jgi:hypothetical protein
MAMTWFGLRARRARPPTRSKLSDSDDRRPTFAAAMAQFEEQFTAAKVVTEFTRPLNLYYGLAQAGLVIAAAHAADPWTIHSHGLRLANHEGKLADMTVGPPKGVRPDGGGGFQRVATATGSELITRSVSLGALWASLPDLSTVGRLPGSTAPVSLALNPNYAPTRTPRALLYLPSEMFADEAELRARFGEIMAAYPSAEGCAIAHEPDAVGLDSRLDKWRVSVRWPAQDASKSMSGEELKAFFDKIAPEYRYRSDRFLRPALDADGRPPPSPLMTWWLLLFSFSILARYQPLCWTKLLDLDEAEEAVLLQYALAQALTAVPHLVIEALDGKPYLLAKPMSSARPIGAP